MAYNDTQFVGTFVLPIGNSAAALTLSTSTATATGTPNTFTGTAGVPVTGTFVFPKFKRATKINNIRVQCTVAAAANLTAVTMNFLNGTNTFAVATNVGAAVGSVDGSVTSSDTYGSNGVITGAHRFAADGQISMTVLTTGTASALTQGSYALQVECQEVFVS